MVARMSWCPETSARVSGRYFSTLGSVRLEMDTEVRQRELPWQRVLSFYRQICSAPLAFLGVGGAEFDRTLNSGSINVHLIIFEVRHAGRRCWCGGFGRKAKREKKRDDDAAAARRQTRSAFGRVNWLQTGQTQPYGESVSEAASSSPLPSTASLSHTPQHHQDASLSLSFPR